VNDQRETPKTGRIIDCVVSEGNHDLSRPVLEVAAPGSPMRTRSALHLQQGLVASRRARTPGGTNGPRPQTPPAWPSCASSWPEGRRPGAGPRTFPDRPAALAPACSRAWGGWRGNRKELQARADKAR